ncbi:MAG: hypothetical protein JKX69_10305 [Rhodobacteraceae bacterium]|nr:hypothetical protein [Paracoccaceae bacterium]
MAILTFIGMALTVLGFFGIIYSLIAVIRAKKAQMSDADLRAKLGKILPVNLGSLAVSFLGLMLVVVGIFLS